MSRTKPSTRIPFFRVGLAATLLAGLIVLVCGAAQVFAAETFAGAGRHAGDVENAESVAVDQSTGTVYVADHGNYRVDEFDSSGHFVMAFGFGVRTGAAELQTCTEATACRQGIESEAPGGFRDMSNITVDQSTHDVYTSDEKASRVTEFNPSGQFVLMFGQGVDEGGGVPSHPGNVCTAEYLADGDRCGDGLEGSGPGELQGLLPLSFDADGNLLVGGVNRIEKFSPEGSYISEISVPPSSGSFEVMSLAVDSDILSPSYGDLYALNQPSSERQTIEPPASGTYTITFEGKTTEPLAYDSPNTNSECEQYVRFDPGTECTSIQGAMEALPAIGAGTLQVKGGGIVEIRGTGEEKYELTRGTHYISFIGALRNRKLPKLTVSAGLTGVSEEGVAAEVRKLESDGVQVGTLDGGGHPTSIAVDGLGDVFVGNVGSSFELEEYNADAIQTKLFAKDEFCGNEADNSLGAIEFAHFGNKLAYGQGSASLYSLSKGVGQGEENCLAKLLTVPPNGPEIAATSPSGIESTTASFQATVNSEGNEVAYHVQYIDQAGYEADGDNFGAGSVEAPLPAAKLPASFEYDQVELALPAFALRPATAYRYRLVAKDTQGRETVSATQGFETEPAVEIAGPSAVSVGASDASLEAQLNPLGAPARYRVVYGTSTSYGSETQETSIGAGSSAVTVTPQLHALEPGTTYHYKFVASDERDAQPYTSESPDLTFTTQQAGQPLVLADHRQWEQVSPATKNGGYIWPLGADASIHAAVDGDALTYLAGAPTEAGVRGRSFTTQVLSRHAASGWSSRDLATPHDTPAGDTAFEPEFSLFSPDLSIGVREAIGRQQFTSLAPESFPEDTESTPYIRHNATCEASPSTCYTPLLTGATGYADVAEGVKFGDETEVLGASPDLTHIVLRSGVQLTEASLDGATEALYEYSTEEPPTQALKLVSLLPVGEGGSPSARAGLGRLVSDASAGGAVSLDGTRIVWTGASGGLYMRDTASGKEETIRLDESQPGASPSAGAQFQLASANGSKVFFTAGELTPQSAHSASHGGLYECIVSETAGHLACELHELGVKLSNETYVVGSEDGTQLYFLSAEALSSTPNAVGERASAGGQNLYAWREDPASGETTIDFVAGISTEDADYWGSLSEPGSLLAGTSVNGDYLAFMSNRSLTGYDNRDARSGVPDDEVYLYDSQDQKLVCASCNPSGERPQGTDAAEIANGDDKVNGWSAARLPPRSQYGYGKVTQKSNYLDSSGRLFFDSSDALVPQDSNGTQDVYEYEPPGGPGMPASDTCTTASSTYSSASEGCVGLISSGTSDEESVFMEASENGDDVFFLTSARLAASDTDTAYDIYDAHVCSVEVPCQPPPPVPAPTCEGDGCQPLAFVPSESAPGSLTFVGAGNPAPVVAPVTGPGRTVKPLSRAQKLAKALRACRKLGKRKRVTCERQARRTYGPAVKAGRSEGASKSHSKGGR